MLVPSVAMSAGPAPTVWAVTWLIVKAEFEVLRAPDGIDAKYTVFEFAQYTWLESVAMPTGLSWPVEIEVVVPPPTGTSLTVPPDAATQMT
jgi:hypothetical protein